MHLSRTYAFIPREQFRDFYAPWRTHAGFTGAARFPAFMHLRMSAFLAIVHTNKPRQRSATLAISTAFTKATEVYEKKLFLKTNIPWLL